MKTRILMFVVVSAFLLGSCNKNQPAASSAADDQTPSAEVAEAPAPEQAATMAEEAPASNSESIADAEIPMRDDAVEDDGAGEGDFGEDEEMNEEDIF